MTRVTSVRTYSKSRLKAHMLEIMRELESTGEEAIVTDHGRPVLRIVPIQQGRSVSQVFAPYRQGPKLVFLEPPDTPTLEEWEGIHGCALVTSDEEIRRFYPPAIW